MSEDIDACLLLPADIPLVRPATVKTIARTLRIGSPFHHLSGVPWTARPPAVDCPPSVRRDTCGRRRRRLARLAATPRSRSQRSQVFDEGILLDMDTPEDYERLAKLAPRRHVPTAAECESILAARAVPDPIRRHGQAVASVAEAMTKQLNAHDVIIAPDLVRAASLLHDIAKGQPAHADGRRCYRGRTRFPGGCRHHRTAHGH